MRLFSKVWKIKFSNIHLMAILVNGLSRYHSDFSIAIVDSVVEEIKIDLEQNNFRHNFSGWTTGSGLQPAPSASGMLSTSLTGRRGLCGTGSP